MAYEAIIDILDQLLTVPPKSFPTCMNFAFIISSPHLQKRAPYSHFTSSRLILYVQDTLILLSEQAKPDVPRVLVSAIEACIYHAPTTGFAIHIVSKIDFTGQRLVPPHTAALARAFIRRYADPATRPITRGRAR